MDDIFRKAVGADPLADEPRRATGAADAGYDAALSSPTLRAATGITLPLPSAADPLSTARGAARDRRDRRGGGRSRAGDLT